MRRKVHVWGSSGALVALALAFTSPALAQAPDPGSAAAAQVLYDKAVDEMKAGQWDAACPRVEEVIRLIPEGVGAKMTLAQCYEGAGRLASAWSTYLVAEAAAARAGQTERQERAKTQARDLEPRLSRIAIKIFPEVAALPDLVVERDGQIVGRAQWGVPVPVDRGEHVVLVRAPGKRPWKTVLPIPTDGLSKSVLIRFLAAEGEPETPPEITQSEASPQPGPRPIGPISDLGLPAPPPKRGTPPLAIAALVSAGVGAAGVGVSLALGAAAIGKRNDSNADGHCVGNHCDSAGAALREDGRTLGNAATAMFVVGAVGLGAGAALWLYSRSAKQPGRPEVGLFLGPQGALAIGHF